MALPIPSSHWLSEKIYSSGDDFFNGLLEDIRHAKRSITFETYIYEDDELGRMVSQELINAVVRGVSVRLMVDGIGSLDWYDKYLVELSKAGVMARVYHPVPWAFHILEREDIRGFEKIAALFGRINRRNHRKVCVIDERVAWLGSMNVTALHLKKYHGNKAWRDTGLRVEGHDVDKLIWAFEAAWVSNRFLQRRSFREVRQRFKRKRFRTKLIRLNHRTRLRRKNYKDLIRKIIHAKERVWITNPYFVPDRSLIRALKIASKCGVDVRLLVPENPDVGFIRFAAAASYGALLKSLVRVFEYIPTVLHAKIVIVDDWVTVGSSNLNSRSLIHDLEVDVVVTLEENKTEVYSQFLKDIELSQEITYKSWAVRSWWQKLLSQLVLMIKYWI